jgi:starch synthase
MRADVLSAYPAVDPAKVHVIYNGIDAEQYSPDSGHGRHRALRRRHDQPSVVFVGRITRQKGVPVLLRAAAQLDPDVQLVLCAGAPDTPELGAEVAGLVEELRKTRSG